MGTQTSRAVRPDQPNQQRRRGHGCLTESLTNITLTIALSGVGRIHGRVLQSDGMTPAVGAEVTGERLARKRPQSFRRPRLSLSRTASLRWRTFPIAPFQIAVVDGALAGSISGVITTPGKRRRLSCDLGPADRSRPVIARGWLYCGGRESGRTDLQSSQRPGRNCHRHYRFARRFRFDSIPVGKVDLHCCQDRGQRPRPRSTPP